MSETVWTYWSCPTCEREWEGDRPRSHLCKDGTIYVSPSTLAAKQTCDLQSWLKAQGAHTTEENVAAKAGVAAHRAFADYYRNADPQQALTLYEEVYRPFADIHVDPNGPLARLTWENTKDVMGEWFRRYKIDEEYVLWTNAAEPNPLVRVVPDMVEVAFQLVLSEEHGVVIIGILDAFLSEYHTGQWLIKDHKTTGRIDKRWWSQWQLDAQVSTYTWAGQELSSKPVMGSIINGVQFHQLPQAAKKKCATHKVPYDECRLNHAVMDMVQYDRSAVTLEDWRKEAIKAARELRQVLLVYPQLQDGPKVRTQGRFNKACRDCFGNAYCAGDRATPVDKAFTILEGMTQKEGGEEA